MELSTGFGYIRIDGTGYDHDIVIHTDRSVSKRRKKESKPFKAKYGHTPLSENELGFLSDEKPEVVYIGTGQYGDLPVTPAAAVILEKYNPVIGPTPGIFGQLSSETRKFVAIIHVTC